MPQKKSINVQLYEAVGFMLDLENCLKKVAPFPHRLKAREISHRIEDSMVIFQGVEEYV